MVRIITTSFGSKFNGAVGRLGKQVRDLQGGYVFGVITLDAIIENSRMSPLKAFFEKNRQLESSSKGFFWYIWKPWVLLRSLCDLNENEVLVYLDAGCELSLEGKWNFQFLVDRAQKGGSVFFRNPQLIKDFTKPSVLELAKEHSYNTDLYHVAAGVLFLRNDKETRKLLRRWCRLSLYKNGFLFDDEGYENHRHDQSILSLIIQEHEFQILDYPIWFKDQDYLSKEIVSFPIHTFRNSSNVSLLSIFKILNKVPFRVWSFSGVSIRLYVFFKKVLFNIFKSYQKNVIWDEKWHLIWKVINSPEKGHFFHRTSGDTRGDLTSCKLEYDLAVLRRSVLINQKGIYKDIITQIIYLNQVKQFGQLDIPINFPSPIHRDDRFCLPLLSLNDDNVFHFIYDLLYKALFLKNQGLVFTCVIKGQQAWKADLMEIFGLNFFIFSGNTLEIRNAFMVSSPIYSGDPSREVINLLTQASCDISEEGNFPKKVLILRRNAPTRRVVNDEIFHALVEEGFKHIDLEDFSVSDQIRIFKNAEVIIAAHGAGLSWLFVCKSSCIVIELFTKNYLNFVYARISAKLSLSYTAIICDSKPDSRLQNDPDIVITGANLKQILTVLDSSTG